MDTHVSLVVPASPEYIPVVKVVVTGAAAVLDIPYDSVEDLRLTITESCNRLLSLDYARLTVKWVYLKARFRGRLVTDGLCFVCPGVTLEIGKHAKLHLGRWSWIGNDTKIRAHEGSSVARAPIVDMSSA